MLNSVCYQGRFTKDPVIKEKVKNGETEQSAFFTLAVQRDYKVNGKTMVDYINCEAYKSTASVVARFFTKGMLATVHGSTIGRKDNNAKYVNVCRVEKIYFNNDKGNVSQTSNKEQEIKKEEVVYSGPSHSDNIGNHKEEKRKVIVEKRETIPSIDVTEDDLPF